VNGRVLRFTPPTSFSHDFETLSQRPSLSKYRCANLENCGLVGVVNFKAVVAQALSGEGNTDQFSLYKVELGRARRGSSERPRPELGDEGLYPYA
jgi:hypothetical protein